MISIILASSLVFYAEGGPLWHNNGTDQLITVNNQGQAMHWDDDLLGIRAGFEYSEGNGSKWKLEAGHVSDQDLGDTGLNYIWLLYRKEFKIF